MVFVFLYPCQHPLIIWLGCGILIRGRWFESTVDIRRLWLLLHLEMPMLFDNQLNREKNLCKIEKKFCHAFGLLLVKMGSLKATG